MRLIDADALKEVIANNVYLVSDCINSRDYGMFWTGGIEKAIDEQPSAEPEWKTGKWIRHPIYEGSDHYYYACSECDYRSWSQDNYCSVCGAKMEVQYD